MASSRSGGGMGVTVALVIFIMLTVAFVLTTMLFYTKMDQARQETARIENDYDSFVKAGERDQDAFKRIANEAQSNRKSVVAHQRDLLKQVMALATGNSEMDIKGFEAFLTSVDLDNSNLKSGYNTERDRADRLEAEVNSIREQLNISESRLADEVAETNRTLANHRTTIDAVNSEIGWIQNRSDDYGTRVEEREREMDRRVTDIRDDYEGRIADLTGQLEDVQNENAAITDALQTLQQNWNKVRGDLTAEGSLPDGEVLDVLEDGSLYINLGRQDHVTLGMRFEVYGDVTEIRANAAGEVPLSKATVEVTRVRDSTSTARAIRSTRGQSVVKNDILVNPIYDRNKSYTFFVYGNFDLDGVNGATELETATVKAQIVEWGGTLTDEFRGDLDFLVVGVTPRRPSPLPPNPGSEPVRRHVEATKFYNNYQDLIAQAANVSIPVLNQNRLFTLIGYYGP